MKNTIKQIGFIALALVTTLAVSGCDSAAKKLAKQTVDAAKQMTELRDKAADIEGKAAALSPKDRRAFQAELERLGVADAPEWLYNDEAALLTGAPEETEDEKGGILGLISGLFGGGSSSGGGSSGGGRGTFTLTGIPSQYNGKYAMLMARDLSRDIAVIGAQTLDWAGKKFTFAPIRSGRVTLNLWAITDAGQSPYRGNDTLEVIFTITNQASLSANDDMADEINIGFEKASFRNGGATQAWNQGERTSSPW
jgi:hypothetical protein